MVSAGVDIGFRKPTLIYTDANLTYTKEHTLVNCANQYLEIL